MKFALNKKTEKKPRNSGNSTGHESPMDVTLLERLVKLMAAHDLNTVDVRDGDKRVILKRGELLAAPAPTMHAHTPASLLAPSSASTASAHETNVHEIKSP